VILRKLPVKIKTGFSEIHLLVLMFPYRNSRVPKEKIAGHVQQLSAFQEEVNLLNLYTGEYVKIIY
jgi:hypothetical protein